MFNIVVALQMWAHLWQDKVIAVRCDNEGAVYVCNTGKTRDKFLNICIQRIWHLTAKYYYYYYVFILSAISPYTTGLKALFTNPTVQVQPQITSN